MIKKLLLIFLSLLIAIQIVAVAVDNHEARVSVFDQTDSLSYADSENHNAAAVGLNNPVNNPVELLDDCNHFCQYHAMEKLVYNLFSFTGVDLDYLVRNHISVRYSSVHIMPNLRPPIA